MRVLTGRFYQDEPREYILKAGPTVIGLKSDGDKPLRDASASRRHMEIINQAEGKQTEIGLGTKSASLHDACHAPTQPDLGALARACSGGFRARGAVGSALSPLHP